MATLSDEQVEEILNNVKYKDWVVEVHHIPDSTVSLMRWTFDDKGHRQYARMWTIDRTMPHSDIVRTALAAAIMAEEHEVRERFQYRGKKVFNPHYDVDKLSEISGKLENLDIPE